MNWIDIIIIVPLAWALYSGWRNGIIVQIGTLVGLAVGVAIAYFIGGSVVSWMNVNSPAGMAATYVALAGAIFLVVVLVARMFSGAFNAAGLGILDRVGGAALSLLKVGIVLSILICGFQWINNKKEIVPQQTLDASALYQPVMNLTSYAFPFMELAREQINRWHETDDKRTDERNTEEARKSIQDNR